MENSAEAFLRNARAFFIEAVSLPDEVLKEAFDLYIRLALEQGRSEGIRACIEELREASTDQYDSTGALWAAWLEKRLMEEKG